MKQCEFCGKFFEKSNISRHIKTCELRTTDTSHSSHSSQKKYTCDSCGISFTRIDNLKRHTGGIKTCQRSSGTSGQRAKIPCQFPSCSVFCKTKIELIEHFHSKHKHESSDNGIGIQSVQFKEFENEIEFFNWKDSEEHMTYSYFPRKNGTTNRTTYYYCQQDGSGQPHLKDGTTRKTSRKREHGQAKVGKLCIASMKVKTLDSGKDDLCRNY